MPQTFIEDPITPKAKAFIEAYHKTYSVNRIPSAVSAAQGYDAVYLFAAAVKPGGQRGPHKIKDRAGGPQGAGPRRDRGLEIILHQVDPNNVETHEASARALRDGHGAGRKVFFAHEEDRQRLPRWLRLLEPSDGSHDHRDHRPDAVSGR